MKNSMNEAMKYFKNMGIPIKNGLIDSASLTNEHIRILREWESKTEIDGIMMPQLEDFYRSVLAAISLNPQKNEEGKIRYLFGKGIGIEIALRGKVQGRNIIETEPMYRSHSDFELYDAKENVYTQYFQDIFGSQEYYPPTKTKGLRDIPEEEMDNTHEIVDLDGYEILVPKLEILFLDKFLKKEATPRESGYDCELLAERYDLDKDLVYEYLKKYYFSYKINEERRNEERTKNNLPQAIIKNLNYVMEEDNTLSIEQAIEILNNKIESFRAINKNISANGIRVDTFIPLTLQDVLMDEQGRIILTQEYIEKAIKAVSDKTNIIIENMQNEILEQLNDVFERAEKSKMIARAGNGKNGFEDCLEDDKTRLSNMQNATRTVRDNILGDGIIGPANDEQNLE